MILQVVSLLFANNFMSRALCALCCFFIWTSRRFIVQRFSIILVLQLT